MKHEHRRREICGSFFVAPRNGLILKRTTGRIGPKADRYEPERELLERRTLRLRERNLLLLNPELLVRRLASCRQACAR